MLLTASGLSNYIGETGLVQKAFMSDPADPKSLVNQLGDSTLLATVQTYDFAKNGLAELKNPKILATLTNGYAEVMWRQSLDQATPGLSNALAFLSQASSIKSFSDILSDPTNFYVVTGALGIPQDLSCSRSTTAQVNGDQLLQRRLREIPGPDLCDQPDGSMHLIKPAGEQPIRAPTAAPT